MYNEEDDLDHEASRLMSCHHASDPSRKLPHVPQRPQILRSIFLASSIISRQNAVYLKILSWRIAGTSPDLMPGIESTAPHDFNW